MLFVLAIKIKAKTKINSEGSILLRLFTEFY